MLHQLRIDMIMAWAQLLGDATIDNCWKKAWLTVDLDEVIQHAQASAKKKELPKTESRFGLIWNWSQEGTKWEKSVYISLIWHLFILLKHFWLFFLAKCPLKHLRLAISIDFNSTDPKNLHEDALLISILSYQAFLFAAQNIKC